jgi:hypothetical protein
MLKTFFGSRCLVAFTLLVPLAAQFNLQAAPFTASYSDGGTWNTIYAQGFNAYVNDGMTVPLNIGDPVPLSRFEFFKSGTADTASNIRLAIITPFFMNLDGLTTASAGFVGVSSNTISNTTGIAEGAPIRFNFESLSLTFGEYYAAVFVNIDGVGNVTPVLVSALTADYVETAPGSGVWAPESNYDFDPLNPTDYNTSTSNYLTVNEFGSFFFGFSGAGDANFKAYFDYTFATTPGDFDNDGDVDGSDFLIWQQGGSPNGATAGDLSDWQTNYGTPAPLVAVNAVPEPVTASMVVAFFGPVVLARTRRTRRC